VNEKISINWIFPRLQDELIDIVGTGGDESGISISHTQLYF